MPAIEKKKFELDEDFIKGIMDFISQLTNMDVSLFYDDKLIFSGAHSEYCEKICGEVDPGICSCLFPAGANNSIIMCKAGLWCRILHITIDEGNLIYFGVGHRRIKGKDEESKKTLHKTFHEYNINNRYRRSELLTLLDQVNSVEEDQFYNPIFNKLTVIEDYINKEYQLFMRERENLLRLKSLTANLAHQLLLPIQSLIGKSWYLAKDLESNSELEYQASDILKGLKRLSYHAGNIRAFIRIESEADYDFKKVNIFSIIEEAIDLFKDEAKLKGVEIRPPEKKSCSFDLIEGSEVHLKQVIFNILQNAVKYSYFGKRNRTHDIYITVTGLKNGYCIDISNYGVGILEQEIEGGSIFSEGYRGILAKDRQRIGSGLGLWTAKKIIENHGGFITITSKPIFELPETSENMAKLYNMPFITDVKLFIPFVQRRVKIP